MTYSVHNLIQNMKITCTNIIGCQSASAIYNFWKNTTRLSPLIISKRNKSDKSAVPLYHCVNILRSIDPVCILHKFTNEQPKYMHCNCMYDTHTHINIFNYTTPYCKLYIFHHKNDPEINNFPIFCPIFVINSPYIPHVHINGTV